MTSAGVAGPVRTGKSTFIKRFMEKLVLPNIVGTYDRDRARDELPQSAGGRTITTTEPKFVPDEAVEIDTGGAKLRVRLIDCVGYVIPEAMGHIENDEPRMVRTPWSDEAVPFITAAEDGTTRVIRDHSTIGILVTTDGTVCDIPRESYVEAEERVASELSAQGKPFAVILNSSRPESEEANALAHELEAKYNAPVALVNCLELDAEDITKILEMIVLEFPVREIKLRLPGWTAALEDAHPLKTSIYGAITDTAGEIKKTGEVSAALEKTASASGARAINIDRIDGGSGSVTADIVFAPDAYYKTVSELTGLDIDSEQSVLSNLKELSAVKREYDKFAAAIKDAETRGYGVVMPEISDMELDTPEIVRQSGGCGIRLHAKAPSVHLIKTFIETEINPIVGTEQQSEDIVKHMMNELEQSPQQLWSMNLFGKSLHELVNESFHAKLAHMPDDARLKFGETLSRVINEGSNGLVCILL